MPEEQKALLKKISEELGGKLSYWVCCDKYTQHKKIVIEYGHLRKEENLS